MILDARTIAALFIDGLSCALVLLVAAIALRGRLGARPAEELDGLGHLLALSMGVLLVLRTVAWALCFLVLEGYVPRVAEQGVLCAYGVVELVPGAARWALWSKPVAMAGLLTWWAIASAERGVAGAPFARWRFALALPVAILAGAEIVAELRFLFADKLATAVTCCSAALDAARDVDWYSGTALFGLSTAATLCVALGAKLALLAACAWAARNERGLRFAIATSIAGISLAVAAIEWIAWREAVAPRALGLEFHRCAYELVTRSALLGVTALAAAFAHLGLLSLPWLALLSAREPAGTSRTARWILGAAAWVFASEIVVLAVHAI